jgi:hypothetical protein
VTAPHLHSAAVPERLAFDPYRTDGLKWGYSMAQHSELMLACLEAVAPRRVVEVGAYAGDLTRVLVDWATPRGVSVTAIDPAPQPELVALETEREALHLVRETSLAGLPALPPDADAIVIDGDHNHWTVSRELALIAARADEAERQMPLVLFHDVAWPHARRDDYFDVEQIPAEARRLPLVGDRAGIVPWHADTVAGGMPYPLSAAHEGGPGNGVLTAVEDFAADRKGLRLAVVPAFFGFGVLWPEQAPWADAVAALVAGVDRDPFLARVEANRVLHLAREHELRTEVWALREELARRDTALRRLLDSRAFEVAEILSRLRVRLGIAPAASIVSRRLVRRALGEER